jgi:hypothetical protein
MRSLILITLFSMTIHSCTKLERESRVIDQGTIQENNCFTYNFLLVDLGENERAEYGLVLKDLTDGIYRNISIANTDQTKEINYLFDSLSIGHEYEVLPFVLNGNDTLFDKSSKFNTNSINFFSSFNKNVVSSSNIDLLLNLNEFCSFKVEKAGVCYSQQQVPTVNDSTIFQAFNSAGSYTFNLYDIIKSKMVYYRPYVVLKNGQISYGNIINHNLQTAQVSTTGVNDLSQLPNSVSLQAEITTFGDDEIDEFGVVYSTTTSSPSYNHSKVSIVIPPTVGKYYAVISNPVKGINYYYRAYVRVGNKVYYGDINTFLW